jgi:predicted metal-dependent hydrolase
MSQSEFGLRDEEALRAALEARSGLRLDLTITDNTGRMLSVRRRGNVAQVRLHHMFLRADEEVVGALAEWARSPGKEDSGELLNAFIRRNRHLVQPKAPRAEQLYTKGRFFDLAAIYDEVNRAQFEGAVDARISWGRRPTQRPARARRRSIRFGSYAAAANLIRIHPALDRDFVPYYAVRYIVYHEMLHAHLGIEESENGRRRIHTPEFRAIERRYPEYRRASAWLEHPANLGRLLR